MAKILIVDDSKTSRTFLMDILISAGYEVVGMATNGAEGVELYRKFHPDIVTMDIEMPVLDGKSAAKKIFHEDANAKIIMVTANNHKSCLEECLELGAAEFIHKPYNKDIMINKIEKVMEE